MNKIDKFKHERKERIKLLGQDRTFIEKSRDWVEESMRKDYVYNFEWMGRPIIQYPSDILVMQELIWNIKPDLIIETGIAHGGSIVFSSAMLELNAVSGGPDDAEVLGVDVDIRQHNRDAIEAHPMYKRINMIEGSSIDPVIIDEVKERAKGKEKILVLLDSNHVHSHVLSELEAYASLTTVGSYCVVFDTFVEDVPGDVFPERPWGPGDNPKTAVWEYLKTHPEFEIDKSIQYKSMITVAPDGFLKRIS